MVGFSASTIILSHGPKNASASSEGIAGTIARITRGSQKRNVIAAPEDAVCLVERKEQVRISCNIFGKPEEEISAGP